LGATTGGLPLQVGGNHGGIAPTGWGQPRGNCPYRLGATTGGLPLQVGGNHGGWGQPRGVGATTGGLPLQVGGNHGQYCSLKDGRGEAFGGKI